MSQFIKGFDLCESFFLDIAQPILSNYFPSLRYAAGLIGDGSDVIGYDDEMSTDHNWGPRFQLFLEDNDLPRLKDRIADVFSAHFPPQYRGYSVNFSKPDWNDGGTRIQEPITHGNLDPLIEYHSIRSFFLDYLAYDSSTEITTSQWLTFSGHRLLGVTSGRIFHNDLGLDEARKKLSYYPQDIWLWMLASQWKMIAEEEAFVGRCGYTGDNLGSRVVSARQVQRLMRLCFLMEKRYAPYSKWFGTAFRQLSIATTLQPVLERVLNASNWSEREEYLCKAYTLVAEKYNSLGLTDSLDTDTYRYFGRPFFVLSAQRFAEAVKNKIHDPELSSLPLIGSVDQFTDSVTLYDDIQLSDKLRHLYQ